MSDGWDYKDVERLAEMRSDEANTRITELEEEVAKLKSELQRVYEVNAANAALAKDYHDERRGLRLQRDHWEGRARQLGSHLKIAQADRDEAQDVARANLDVLDPFNPEHHKYITAVCANYPWMKEGDR